MQELLFLIPVLIMSVVVHEISHGYIAEILGDPTARIAGRLTLNPINHLDLFGSILIPGLLIISGSSFLFGWAKPVPYNPYNLGKGKWGPGLVAIAGPASNLLIAFIFSLFLRFGSGFEFIFKSVDIVIGIVLINLLLAFFNLIPIPPLDGSKVVGSFLTPSQYISWQRFETIISQYGLLFIFFFLFILFPIISPILSGLIGFFFELFTGLSLEL